jgi:hypothetical protein
MLHSRGVYQAPYGVENARSAFWGLVFGLQKASRCDVPGIFVDDPGLPASLS